MPLGSPEKQSQSPAFAGNPKHEALNSKQTRFAEAAVQNKANLKKAG